MWMAVLLSVVPAPAHAAVGGVTGISDRQEAVACSYARGHAPVAKRAGYADACASAASVEQSANALADITPFTYENPVYGSSFPDPGALANGSTDYYAYATGGRFPIIKSPDLVHWEVVGHAFSARPSWVVQTGDWHPWAPSVLRSSEACPGTSSPGCFFMYYVGLSGRHTPATHCVGVAWSLTASGPFTDLGPLQAEDGATDLAGRPPGCGDAAGYSNIDPAPFTDDDGSVYLYVSTGRHCAQPTTGSCPYEPTLSTIPLTSTPTKAAAPRKPLFGASSGSWEQEPGAAAAVVENPWMEKRGDTYYLFYSGGSYLASYGMGYATSAAPAEGFAKSSLNPILAETEDVLSPGGGSVVAGPGAESWLVYHGRADAYTEPRTLRIDPVYWSGTSVFTPGPTTGPQTFPPEEPPAPPGEPPSGEPPAEPPPADPAGTGSPSPPAGSSETAAPPDLVAPIFELRARRSQRARKAVAISVSAGSEDLWASAAGRVRFRGTSRTRALGSVDARYVPHGSTAVIRLTISKATRRAIRRALRHGRRVTANLRVAARDASGNVRVRTRTVRLASMPRRRSSASPR
jgi:hypothetical protein